MKIWLTRTLKFVLALILFYSMARFIDVYSGSVVSGERAVYLQLPTSQSMTLRWQTTTATTGSVHYGTNLYRLDKRVYETESDTMHSVRIGGLEPDTRYYYVVANDVDDSHNMSYHSDARNWFRTLPHAGAQRPTRLWVMGDSGDVGPVANQVRDAALNWVAANPRYSYPDIDVWLGLGDLAYTSGTDGQYQSSLFGTFAEQLRNHPLWPVYGNHDDRRWTYFKIFSLPEQGEVGGEPSGTENYYSFDYGEAHIIVLDSQDSERSADGAMLQWLQRDLALNKSKWLITAFHHPPYSKGTHDSDDASDSGGRMKEMRENVLPILEAADVDLVLSGHSHMYERSNLTACHYSTSDTFDQSNIVSDGVAHKSAKYLKPARRQPHSGTVYVVAGSASKVDTGPIDHPALPVSMLEAGSLIIDLEGDQLTSRFINSEGKVSDEFTIVKKVGHKSKYPGCKSLIDKVMVKNRSTQ